MEQRSEEIYTVYRVHMLYAYIRFIESFKNV